MQILTTIAVLLGLFGPTPQDALADAAQAPVIDRKQVPELKDAAGVQRALAHARLTLEVDGNPEAARDEVVRLKDQIERAGEFEGRAQVVLDYVDFATSLHQRLGEADRAAALVDAERASIPWKAVIGSVVATSRFQLVKQRVQQGSATSSAEAARIEQLVRKAIADGSPNAVEALGIAAVPTLEAILREEPEALPDWSKDALYALVGIAPQRAAAVSLELLRDPRAGFLLRKRVLRAMNSKRGVLSGDGPAWRFESYTGWNDRPPVLLTPEWRDVLTAVTTSPLVASDAMGLVAKLVDNDALDEPLRQSLLTLTRSGEPGATAGVANALQNGAVRSTVRPLLEALLTSPAIELRLVAANHLALEERSEALLARADDPEPRVREAVAAGLAPGSSWRPRFHPNGPTMQESSAGRSFQERDRPLLMHLLADSDAGARRAALDVAWKAGQRLEPATAAKLLSDGDAQSRARVPRLLPKDPAVAAPLLERALHDTAPEVRKEAETELLARFGIKKHESGGDTTGFPELDPTPALLPLALASFDGDGPRLGRAARDSVGWSLVAVLLEDPDDCRAFVRWWLDAADGHGLAAAGVADRLARAVPDGRFPWSFLDVDALYAVLRRAVAENGPYKDLPQSFRELPGAGLEGDVLARLVCEPDVPLETRLEYLPRIARHPRAAECAVAVLQTPPWKESDASNFNAGKLSQFAKWTTPEVLRAVLERTWDDPAVRDLARLALLDGACDARTAPAEYAARALARDPEVLARLSSSVLPWAVATEGAAGRWGAAHDLLGVANLQSAVIRVLGERRPPEALAWLGDVLLDPATGAPRQSQAAKAIAGYLSDEAADLLLRGAAAAPNEDVRGACLDGVEQIRTYMDQKASWQQRATGVAQRDAAVAELVRMLDDQDPTLRSQAVRGLATLQAVEHLPRLIRLLQDPDMIVRKAAQQALDRLNEK